MIDLNTKRQELEVLVNKGVITTLQMQRLLEDEVSKAESAASKDTTSVTSGGSGDVMQKIITFGAVLVGLGIILFIGTNWEVIPDAVKTMMLFVVVIASYMLGVFLRDSKNLFRTGEAIMLIGAFAMGGGMALVSQTYNVFSETYAIVVLLWALALIFPTYIFLSKPHSVFLAIILGIALQLNIFEHVPYAYNNYYNLISAMTLLSSLFLFTVGGLHYFRNEYVHIGKLYRYMAVLFGTVSLYSLTYFNYVDRTMNTSSESDVFYYLLLLAGVNIILCFLSLSSNVPKDMVRKYAHIFPMVLSIFVPLSYLLNSGYGANMLIVAVYNILFVGSLLYIIYFGHSYQYSSFVNYGIIILGLYLLSRSIQWIWTLQGPIFFISTGVLIILFGLAFEKVRVNLLKKTN
jgi:uncharacterized membrane protein